MKRTYRRADARQVMLASIAVLALIAPGAAAENAELKAALANVSKEAKKATVDTDYLPLADLSLSITADAIAADDFTTAGRASTMSVEFAKRAGSGQLLYRATQKSEDTKALAKEFNS